MSCPICFEDITAGTGKVELSCSHSFHYGCLTNWFGNQMAKDIEESCPCCRHVANQHERLPDIDVETESSASDLADQQENARNLAQHIANERAQTKFENLRSRLSKDEFEAYAATRINAVMRGYWWRKNWLEHKYLDEEVALIRRRLHKVTSDLVKKSRRMKFHLPCVTMSRQQWLNTVATKIQAIARGWAARKMVSYERSKAIIICLREEAEGWQRSIFWEGGLPPQEIAFQMHRSAKKIQEAWRARLTQRVTQN